MKTFLYWFLGDRGGRITVGMWAWLVGRPLDAGDARTVAIAQRSVDDVAEAVEKLTKAVAQQYSALQQADALLDTMQSQQQDLGQQAERLVQGGEDSAALTVLAELEVIEASLPQIQAQVKTARSNFEVGKERLNEQQRQLQQMKLQQKVSASLQGVTTALEQANAMGGLTTDSATSTFETAQEAVNRRSVTATAYATLQSHGQQTQRKASQLKAADRLAALKAKISQSTADAKNGLPSA